MKDRLIWLVWVLLTGGVRSPIRHLPEGVPILVTRFGKKLILERAKEPAMEAPRPFAIGSRVVVLDVSGFARGARGVVVFQEPTAQGRVWVMRDGASHPVFFYPYELKLESEVEA